MRVLNVNKYYQLTGGGDRFFFDLATILTGRGHEVIPFCLDYPGNRPTEYSPFFPPGVSGEKTGEQGFMARARLFTNGVYSREAEGALDRLLAKVRPDVAHLHVLHYAMSPSVINALDRAGVPIVFSLHDYRVVCANGFLYRDGKECHDCRGGRFYNAVRHKCYRGGVLSSLMGAAGNYLYASTGLYDKVDLFTIPHGGMSGTLADFGWPSAKMRILRNPLMPGPEPVPPPPRDHVIYFGNITPQKGVFTLVRAAQRLPEVPFLICGKGPHLEELKAFIRETGVRNVRVDDASRWDSGLQNLIASSRFAVIPSEWPAPLEYSLLEAMSLGKAVAASRTGGNQSAVEDGITGVLFSPGDPEDLARAVRRLYADPEACARMGAQARAKVKREFSPEAFYDDVLRIYQEAITARASRSAGPALVKAGPGS